jgi:hypothetical protein
LKLQSEMYSFFLQSLKNNIFYNEAKLIEAKQSLNWLRKGDLLELSKYLFNLPLLPIPFITQSIGFIKVNPKMVLELILLMNLEPILKLSFYRL